MDDLFVIQEPAETESEKSIARPYYEVRRGRITFPAFTTLETASAWADQNNDSLTPLSIDGEKLAIILDQTGLGGTAAICIDGGEPLAVSEFICQQRK